MKKIITAIAALLVVASMCGAAAMSPAGNAKYLVADISHYNTITDWGALKGTVNGLYIKATEGVTYTDAQYAAYTSAAKQQGIPLGFYHFFWPWSGDNGPYKARQQADSFWRAIKGNSMQLLPVIDVEETNGCTADEIAADVGAFCDELVRVDGAPGVMVYCSPSFATSYLTGLTQYPLWVAHYGVSQPAQADGWSNWDAWQYTSTGTIAGVYGSVDLNKADDGVYLISAPSNAKAAYSPSVAAYNASDYCPVSSLPCAINSRAGTSFAVRDSAGNIIPGHTVSKGDPLIILSVDYDKQLAEVLYPVPSRGAWYHGYISNAEKYLHNVNYNKWRNGGTPEPVYSAAGQRIGTIDARERATVLYKQGGMTAVLYSTAKGNETKSGFVRYKGR